MDANTLLKASRALVRKRQVCLNPNPKLGNQTSQLRTRARGRRFSLRGLTVSGFRASVTRKPPPERQTLRRLSCGVLWGVFACDLFEGQFASGMPLCLVEA